MIEIRTRLLEVDRNMKAGEALRRVDHNKNAVAWAAQIRAAIGTRACPVGHYPATGIITIIVQEDGVIRVEKTGFCCQHFSDCMHFDIGGHAQA